MEDDEFVWDDFKAEANLKNYGISFETARRVFDDDFSQTDFDSDSSYDEDRYFIVGSVDAKVIFVSYSYQGDRVRLISARPATRREANAYYRGESLA